MRSGESKYWRFIDSAPLDGPGNMALDEALLSTFDPCGSLPVFRLYGWDPPAISFGRFQDPAGTLDPAKCRESGVMAVRRITAGGIIYHADEITYSIVCGEDFVPGGHSVKESFEKLCGFLLLTYRKLGLAVGFAKDGNTSGVGLGRRTPLCFAGREEYDIIVDGRKIGGNAQRRKRGVIFQHGSIPLANCLAEGLACVRENQRPAMLEQNTVSLGELGIVPDIGTLKKIMAESFEACLGVSLLRSFPTADESRTAVRLREYKYSRDSWNMEGIHANY